MESEQNYAEGGLVEDLTDATRGALHGGAFGLSDEAEGMIGALYAKAMRPDLFEEVDVRDLYREGRDRVRAENDESEERSPWLYAGSDLVGSAFIPMGSAKNLTSLTKNAAGYGALYGYGDSEAEDLKTQLQDAGISSAQWASMPLAWKYKKLLAPVAAGLLTSGSTNE